MRLHYYQDRRGNFGDDLNPWLWERLIPDLLDGDGRTLLVGIGTILNDRLPWGPGKVVFGAGFGYGAIPVVDERWRFYCVRGPRTAAALGLQPDLAITDPAILMRHFLPPIDDAQRSGIVFVPHRESVIRADALHADLCRACTLAGVTYIDPGGPLMPLLQALRSATLVLAEAMHAAILADAFRVPWIPVQLFDHILGSKWLDWTDSLRVSYRPNHYPLYQQPRDAEQLALYLRQTVRTGRREMSNDEISETAMRRLLARLDRLREDHGSGSLPVGEPSPPAALPLSQERSWWHRLEAALDAVRRVVPVDERFLLLDETQWQMDDALLRDRSLPFPNDNGAYAGPPADDADAVTQIEAASGGAGARYLVVGWPAFWWLEHYPAMAQRLRQAAVLVHRDADVEIYRWGCGQEQADSLSIANPRRSQAARQT